MWSKGNLYDLLTENKIHNKVAVEEPWQNKVVKGRESARGRGLSQ